MSIGVFFIVLLAALLHAGWNAILKKEADKLVGALGVALGSVPLAAGGLLIAGPPPSEVWPLIVLSALLHTGYFLFLLNAYRFGDLTQVYPVARGAAPLLTAAFAALVLSEAVTTQQSIAIVVIALGVASLVFTAKGEGRLDPVSFALALATSVFISAYSLNDGAAARLAGNSLSFYGAAALLNSAMMVVVAVAVRRRSIGQALRKAKLSMIVGGPASFIAYALVTWAFTQAPIAVVSALRETSVVFALILGSVALKEQLNWLKVASTFLTLSGVVVLRLQK